MARSAGIETRLSVTGSDATMSNAAASRPAMRSLWNSAIRAAGGGASCSAATKASSAAGGPYASIVTPDASLRTHPPTPCAMARR